MKEGNTFYLIYKENKLRIQKLLWEDVCMCVYVHVYVCLQLFVYV